MICTYIFRDANNGNTLAKCAAVRDRNTYLKFTPVEDVNSDLWQVNKIRIVGHDEINNGCIGFVKVSGLVVSAHTSVLVYGVSDWVNEIYYGGASRNPIDNSVFIRKEVIKWRRLDDGSYPQSVEVKPTYLKPILGTDNGYHASHGEETGYYMASVIHVASNPNGIVEQPTLSMDTHVSQTLLAGKILDSNNVTHKSRKPFLWFGDTSLYYDPNCLYSSDSNHHKYDDQGFEIACVGGIWEGEDNGFRESPNLTLPARSMPIVYCMPAGTVRSIEEKAEKKLGEYDVFPIATFSIYPDSSLTKRVVNNMNANLGIY